MYRSQEEFTMNEPLDNRQKWVLKGYELFSALGPEALNVEKLSSLVGLNRSSFYHYFKNISGFEEALFDYHAEQYQHIGNVIKDYDHFEQLFNDEVFEYREALSFQRQLLINQSKPRYQQCSEEVRKYTGQKTFELWSAENAAGRTEEEQWQMFRAMRDFYFVHHDQPNGLENPKEIMMLLNKFVNRN